MELPAAFGKYHLLERLAVGGMAEVFLAKAFGAAGFERILVIKKILPHMSEDEDFITMFIDEARIASSLSHSNIIQITELGKEQSGYYIAMEYVMGKDLSRIFEKLGTLKQTMPISLAVLIASRISEGLEYAHRKKDSSGKNMNIIHRDVSPGNILVSYDGDIKLIDFGIAKAQMRMGRTSAGTLKGKFGYMSPEQVRGKRLDHRSDIFSVGILLYEMLTGEKLFGSKSDFGTLEKVRNASVAPPSTFNSRIPDELERLVMKALAREPEERFEWASDMQEALMRFMVNDGSLTTSKSLSLFMKETFTKELMLENRKMAVYRKRGYPWVDAAKGEDPKNALKSISADAEEDDPYEAAPKTTMDDKGPTGSILTPATDSLSEEATQIFYSNPSIPLQAEDPWANEPEPEQQPQEKSSSHDALSDPKVNEPTIIFDEEELSGESESLDDFDTYEGEQTEEIEDFDEEFPPPEQSTQKEGKPLSNDQGPVFTPDQERRLKQEAARKRLKGESSNSGRKTNGTEYMAGRKGRAGPLRDRPESKRPKTAGHPRKQHSTLVLLLAAAAVGLVASIILGNFLFFHNSSRDKPLQATKELGPEPLKPTMSDDTKKDSKAGPTALGDPQANTLKKTGQPSDQAILSNSPAEHDTNADTNADKQAGTRGKGPNKHASQSEQLQDPRESNSVSELKPHGVLHVSSIPGGADIFVDGKPRGKTPNDIKDLDQSQPVLVALKKKGYRNYTEKIIPTTGTELNIEAQLQRITTKHKQKNHHRTKRHHKKARIKGTGWLVANTSPWAKVIIDGKDTGLWTPVVGKNRIKLRAGKHIIVFRTKDGRRAKRRITIKKNSVTKLIIKNIP